MKKIMIITMLLNISLYANFMSNIEGLIKSGIGGEKKVHHFPKEETVGTINTISTTEKKEKSTSYIDDIMNTVQGKREVPKKESVLQNKEKSTLTSIIDTVKDTLGIEEKKKKDESMFSSVISTAKRSIGIEDKKPDMLSIDGIKDTILSSIGMTPKDTSVIGTIKSTTTGVFSDAKNAGKATQLASGISYKSTKLMNKAVETFSDSPLNIFQSKKDKESDVLGKVLDAGNSFLKLAD